MLGPLTLTLKMISPFLPPMSLIKEVAILPPGGKITPEKYHCYLFPMVGHALYSKVGLSSMVGHDSVEAIAYGYFASRGKTATALN